MGVDDARTTVTVNTNVYDAPGDSLNGATNSVSTPVVESELELEGVTTTLKSVVAAPLPLAVMPEGEEDVWKVAHAISS